MKEIQITVAPGENFTPAGLMQRYAKQTPGVTYTSTLWGNSQLTIEGIAYCYHRWKISGEVVTLYLMERERYEGLNLICRNCAELGKGCEGTPCPTWTGCVHRRISRR